MKRVPFSQIIKDFPVDDRKEYDRLYQLFNHEEFYWMGKKNTLRTMCESDFLNYPFRGTCLTLDDYCETYNLCFEVDPKDFDMDYLISFCEYTFNILHFAIQHLISIVSDEVAQRVCFYNTQIVRVLDLIGYMPNSYDNGITDFVPKDSASIAVAEIVDAKTSYKVIEYNHHSMRRNLDGKRAILKDLGDLLEPQRSVLHTINPSLENDVFFLLNSINIRHNNIDKDGSYYQPFVAEMSNEEIENWYDELYQMCLLSFLEIDQSERKTRVDDIKHRMNDRKEKSKRG